MEQYCLTTAELVALDALPPEIELPDWQHFKKLDMYYAATLSAKRPKRYPVKLKTMQEKVLNWQTELGLPDAETVKSLKSKIILSLLKSETWRNIVNTNVFRLTLIRVVRQKENKNENLTNNYTQKWIEIGQWEVPVGKRTLSVHTLQKEFVFPLGLFQ